MAITLPTFTINDTAKETRLLDAFRPTPTSTNAEAAAAYREWLRKTVVAEVVEREQQAIRQAASNEMVVKAKDAETLLA